MSKNISLTEKAQFAFIQNANHNEMLNFIKDYPSFRFSSNAGKVFVERGNSKEILAYIATRPLSERGELALIHRGFHHEILAYAHNHKFYESAEKALIKRGVKSEILAYLENSSFSANAIIELIHRGSLQEIEKAATHGSFGFRGEVELLKFGIHRHIMAYIKIRKFCNELALQELFKRNDAEEIELYRSLYGVQ